ncbi:unnamed protein product, partial [marine sediment metagenome]
GDCEATLVHGDGGQIVEAKFTDIDVHTDELTCVIEFNESIKIQKGDLLSIIQTLREGEKNE